MALDLTALSTALSTLASTPGAVQLLGAHLTSSQEMQAIAILDQMAANPAGASALLPAFSAIPNMPAVVSSDVVTAISTPALFASQIAAARSALVSSATSTTTLGGLLGL
jgi:hypothetical protein